MMIATVFIEVSGGYNKPPVLCEFVITKMGRKYAYGYRTDNPYKIEEKIDIDKWWHSREEYEHELVRRKLANAIKKRLGEFLRLEPITRASTSDLHGLVLQLKKCGIEVKFND